MRNKDLLKAYQKGRKEERKEILKEIEGVYKKIDKKRTTEEKRYPHGYNQARNDILNLLTHSKK